MITTMIHDKVLEIRPITRDDLNAVLDVYKKCEDFLALGPAPTASMEMVLKDIEISNAEGGIFCGIYTADGNMIRIVDYVPGNYHGEPQTAFLELLMIADSFRKQGIGKRSSRQLRMRSRKMHRSGQFLQECKLIIPKLWNSGNEMVIELSAGRN